MSFATQIHTQGIRFFALTGDRYIVSASNDGDVVVWDKEYNVVRMVLKGGHISGVKHIAVNVDYNRIVSCGFDGVCVMWEMFSGRRIACMKHGDVVNIAVFSICGKYVVTGSDDGMCVVWNGISGEKLYELDCGGRVNDVVFSLDGMMMATCADKCMLWNCNKGGVLDIGVDDGIEPHLQSVPPSKSSSTAFQSICQVERYVKKAVFSLDGEMLYAIVGMNYYGWNVDSMKLCVVSGVCDSMMNDMAISGCGKWIVTGSRGGSVCVWEARIGALVRRFDKHNCVVNRVDFSEDAKYVVSCGDDGRVLVFDWGEMNIVKEIQADCVVACVRFNGDRDEVIYGDDKGNIVICSVKN